VVVLSILAIVLILGIVGVIVYKSFEKNSNKTVENKSFLSRLVEMQSVINTKIGSNMTYNIVDTNQNHCFDDNNAITCSKLFNGQDAQYKGNQPKYQDNGDGTVTDLNTNLMWLQSAGDKVSYSQGANKADSFSFAGYDDWRTPSIKELYSLIDFSGTNPNVQAPDASGLSPFINTDYFDFEYGDTSVGDRIIDSQWITSNVYVATTMGQKCFFGVNFADGRIKCYPIDSLRNNGYFMRYVRGDLYGENSFKDNGDMTISDNSTGLMWQQNDSLEGMIWKEALDYCEELNLASYDDWRLPNAKELQSIVDYTRSPDTTSSPAIDPVFVTTSILNEAKQTDYPFYWTGTTHLKSDEVGSSAVYIAFGRALGFMNNQWMDVHGAGAQRSDPKSGNINEYPSYFGPQGDVRRLNNYVRCVRGGVAIPSEGEDPSTTPSNTANGQPGQQPPENAISACSGKTENSSCTMQTPQGNVSGTCRNVMGGLACVPN
jgi:hypothetical protein